MHEATRTSNGQQKWIYVLKDRMKSIPYFSEKGLRPRVSASIYRCFSSSFQLFCDPSHKRTPITFSSGEGGGKVDMTVTAFDAKIKVLAGGRSSPCEEPTKLLAGGKNVTKSQPKVLAGKSCLRFRSIFLLLLAPVVGLFNDVELRPILESQISQSSISIKKSTD